MKLLFCLSEEEMFAVYEEVQKFYFREDVEAVIYSMNEDGVDHHFTDKEIDQATRYAIEAVQENVCYMDFAREALNDVLAERGKEED